MEYSSKKWYKKWRSVITIIFLAIILFLSAVSFFYFIAQTNKYRKEINQNKQPLGGQKYETAAGDHYWFGSPKAKIVIVEFGDFACPVCLEAFPTVREISLKYNQDIKFIWRDLPVVQEYSVSLAFAGRCAGEQGLFWPMHDKLFQNQGAISSLADQNGAMDASKLNNQLLALANQIGADQTKFKDCLDKQKYLPQIQKDLADGQTFGVAGTPTYFINGYKIAGDIPYDTFIKIIEELKK